MVTLAVAALVAVISRAPVAVAHTIPPNYDPSLPSPITVVVDDITPDLAPDAFVFEGDGGLGDFSLSAQPGHDVVVLGYEGEPYLHIDTSGQTSVNRASPSAFINANTQGGDAIPADATGSTPPRWEPETGKKGSVSWHDHRIHWMQTGPPPTVAGSDLVQNYELKLVVDDTPVVIKGSVHYDASIPWSNYQIALTAPSGRGITAEAETSSIAPVLAVVGGLVVVIALAVRLELRTRARRRGQRPPA
jgi:hypothetical protein